MAANDRRRERLITAHRGSSTRSAPIVDRGRLECQRAEVDVALAAMMNLVIDDVEDEIVDHTGVLAERGGCFVEALRRYLRPEGVELTSEDVE